jgi:hypothetical protein
MSKDIYTKVVEEIAEELNSSKDNLKAPQNILNSLIVKKNTEYKLIKNTAQKR